ncbi:MAG: hypothetical protein ABIM36_04525 [candidate division WOR-3 bacterium]
MKRQFFVLLFFAFLKAQQIILPTVDNFELIVKVSVKDSVSLTYPYETHYIYEYTLINSPSSGQPVYIFEIPWFARYYYPPLYHYLKGDTSFSRLGYKTIPKRACWLHLSIRPGDTVSGFVFITKELPSISDAYAQGFDSVIVCPEVYGLPEDIAEDTLNKIYFERTPYGPGKVYKTVGPGPYPPMKPIWPWGHYPDSAFIHLGDRLGKCKEQGWLTQHAFEEIKRIIGHAWNHIQQGRLEQSKRTLTRLMETLERLKGQEKITEEAFYILYYRTKYVRDNLWYKP